jgi:phytoene dehydrogenase-like protein
LATFQDLYVGLEPNANHKQLWGGILRKTAPAVFGLLAGIELHPTNAKSGVFAPIGGFQQVIESITELCTDLNVEIRYDTSVTRVTTDGVHYIDRTGDNNRDGYLEADLIICNADIPYATETILKSSPPPSSSTTTTNNALTEKETFDWNDKLDYSSGVIAYHWSISQSLTALNTHNIFLSANTTSDMERSWSVLRDDDDSNNKNLLESKQSMIGMPFNFYVHRASKVDSTACPENCDSIMVLVPCPTLIRDKRLSYLPRNETIETYKQQFTNDYIDDVRDAVLHRMSVLKGLENMKKFILHEVFDNIWMYVNIYLHVDLK